MWWGGVRRGRSVPAKHLCGLVCVSAPHVGTFWVSCDMRRSNSETKAADMTDRLTD